MSVLWPALLAAGALACLHGGPRGPGLRLEAVVGLGPGSSGRGPARPVSGAAPGRPVQGGPAATHPAGRAGVALVGAGVVIAGVTAFALGVVPAALALLGAGLARRAVRARAVRAARATERAHAVEACGALAAELRAGRAPAEALQAAADLATGPSRSTLAAAAGALRLGGDPAAALRPPADTAVPDVLRALAACCTVCSGSGGGLAAAAERLEEGLRSDQAQRRAVEAELAGPRATAVLLAVLPAAGLLLAAGLGVDPMQVLLGTPAGLVCLTGGLALDGLGLWWTGRLVARVAGA